MCNYGIVKECIVDDEIHNLEFFLGSTFSDDGFIDIENFYLDLDLFSGTSANEDVVR